MKIFSLFKNQYQKVLTWARAKFKKETAAPIIVQFPPPKPVLPPPPLPVEVLFIFNDSNDFFKKVKDTPEFLTEPEVNHIVGRYLDIANPKVCPCVHGALREGIEGTYNSCFPLIQARNPLYFVNMKMKLEATQLVFKTGGKEIYHI